MGGDTTGERAKTVLELGRDGERLVCSFDFPNMWAPDISEKVGRARMRQYRRWRRRGSRIRHRAARACASQTDMPNTHFASPRNNNSKEH